MSTRYGDRGFGRYGDPEDDRTEDRDYERGADRVYGDAGDRYGRGPDYGAARRGGPASARGGDYSYARDFGYGRDYGLRDPNARDYGSREYGSREYGSRYGREGLAGGYAGITSRRREDEDYGRDYGSRAYSRDRGREYGRAPERVREREGVRDYDTDYGRTTSRFYGRSGYEYGREDYDRDEERAARGEYGRRAYAGRGDEREGRGRGWWDRAADEVLSWFGDEGAERRRRTEELHAGGGRGEGKFRGRGPKNYRRSDERIREEVGDRLTDNEWLDASDVEINVAAGEIILTGTVDSRYAKRLAEDIAGSVSGVSNVQNNLRVHSYEAATAGAAGGATAAGVTDVTATTINNADAPASPDATKTGLSSKAAGRS